MKLYATAPIGVSVPQYIIDSNVSGITVRVPFANFLLGDDYNNSFLTNNLFPLFKKITDSGKEIAMAVIFGNLCSTPFYEKYGFAEFITKPHGDPSKPEQRIKVPLFWKEEYILKLNDFLRWLSQKLIVTTYYDVIHNIKICWANERTEETRATSQDWSDNSTTLTAYNRAAQKWLDKGYNIKDVLYSYVSAAALYRYNFPGRKTTLVLIGGKNGFPCIDRDGKIILPSARENINQEIINSFKYMHDVMMQSSALTDIGGKPPEIENSGLPIIYQVHRQKFGFTEPPFPKPDSELEKLKAVIENGKNASIIEIHPENILSFPTYFNNNS